MNFLIAAILFAVFSVAVQAEEKVNENRRVYGGKPATNFQFPYQAGLKLSKLKGYHVCGGSLISSTRVLTVAHCFKDILSVLVILGARILDVEESTQVRINVPLKEIVLHPQFDDDKLHNDVAIIKLPSSVTFTIAISPIALPEGKNDYADVTGILSGWGFFDNSKKNSLFLRFANLKIMKNSECDELVEFVIDSTMCATGQGKTDGCDGDSGQI